MPGRPLDAESGYAGEAPGRKAGVVFGSTPCARPSRDGIDAAIMRRVDAGEDYDGQ